MHFKCANCQGANVFNVLQERGKKSAPKYGPIMMACGYGTIKGNWGLGMSMEEVICHVRKKRDSFHASLRLAGK